MKPKIFLIYALIGCILGIFLDLLRCYEYSTVFPYSFLSLWGLLFGLAYNDRQSPRLIMSSLIAALLLSLPLIALETDKLTLEGSQTFSFLCAFPIFAFVVHSFHYALHHDNSFKLNYNTLFVAVWNTLPLLFVAFIFLLLANLLLMLTAFIFKTVNATFFWDLYFYNKHFYIISYAALFFTGLGIGQQSVHIINNLRYLLLGMMYYLLPFLALISILYVFLYWGHLISGSKEYVSPLPIISSLTILGIIFFNGYFQDGKRALVYSKKLRSGLKGYRVILFFLTLMLAYQVIKDVSPLSINVVFYLFILVLYGIAYAVTAFMHDIEERERIRGFNIKIALVFLTGLFVLNNPVKPVVYHFGGNDLLLGSNTDKNNKEQAYSNDLPELQNKNQLRQIDNRLESLGFSWQPPMSAEGFIAGYSDNEAIYICRSLYKNGYEVGQYAQGQCIITYAGQAFEVNDYHILTKGNLKKIEWFWYDYYHAGRLIITGFEPVGDKNSELRDLYSCRTIYNNRIHIGKLVAENCNIAFNGEEIVINNFQVLSIK